MAQVLHQGLLQGWEHVGAETYVNNELAKVGGFQKVTEEGFGSDERIWKPSLRLHFRR